MKVKSWTWVHPLVKRATPRYLLGSKPLILPLHEMGHLESASWPPQLPVVHAPLRSLLFWSLGVFLCHLPTQTYSCWGYFILPFPTGATIEIFFWEGSHPSVFLHFFSWGFFFFSLFRLPKSFWSLSLSLRSQCWINILYWEIDHRALGYRCLTRAPTPVSNGGMEGAQWSQSP